jgi:hypothetical protein
VLHVDGGEDIEPYDPFDNVIRLDPKALHRSLRLTRIEAYAGTCGGPHLRPETPRLSAYLPADRESSHAIPRVFDADNRLRD